MFPLGCLLSFLLLFSLKEAFVGFTEVDLCVAVLELGEKGLDDERQKGESVLFI